MQEGTTDQRGRWHPPQCTTLMSAHTIRRRLQHSGLFARRPLLGLPLTQNHRRLRRQWCDERRMWAAEWNEVVFTDESRICLQHHDGRIRVWRHRGEDAEQLHFAPPHCSCTGYYGMGGIGYHSRTPLVRVKQPALVWSQLSFLTFRAWPQPFFQQDNARPHVVRIVQRFFVNHQIELLPWTARSPDISPIENMWSMVDQRLTQITPQLPHHITFSNVWKLLGLLYPKNTSKVSMNQCRSVWQR
ncbi:transposable element Tcb1 transposase [Trichonephila clavipes]|nr:transposable element Tcb1 transposase [Trichonephila clavipes]